MRKVFFGLASLAMLSAGAQKKGKETIEGNGKSVSRDVTVSAFDALQASGIYELKLSQGDKEGVTITADENLQEYFTVKNEGSKLVIDMSRMKNKNLKNKGTLKVHVTFKKLRELDLRMVGNVASEKSLSFDALELKNQSVGNVDLQLSARKLELDNESVGNVKLSGQAREAVVRNEGVGNLKAGNFVVQEMDIENSGVGNAEVHAEKTLKVKDCFMGKVSNKGAAPMRKMNKVRV